MNNRDKQARGWLFQKRVEYLVAHGAKRMHAVTQSADEFGLSPEWGAHLINRYIPTPKADWVRHYLETYQPKVKLSECICLKLTTLKNDSE